MKGPFTKKLKKKMDFFRNLKKVGLSITIENDKGLILNQNFPNVHELAQFLKEHPEVAFKVGYGNKKQAAKKS